MNLATSSLRYDLIEIDFYGYKNNSFYLFLEVQVMLDILVIAENKCYIFFCTAKLRE